MVRERLLLRQKEANKGNAEEKSRHRDGCPIKHLFRAALGAIKIAATAKGGAQASAFALE